MNGWNSCTKWPPNFILNGNEGRVGPPALLIGNQWIAWYSPQKSYSYAESKSEYIYVYSSWELTMTVHIEADQRTLI